MSIFSGGDALKFEEEGDVHVITVDEVEDIVDQYAEEGDSPTVTVIRGLDEDGDECVLYVRKRQLGYAIGQAVKEATGKAEAPAKGSTLKIKRGEDGEPRQKGHNPPHTFQAKYEPPKAGGGTFGDDDDEEPF